MKRLFLIHNYTDNKNTLNEKWEDYGVIAVGTFMAIGMDFPLSSTISINSELFLNNLSYYPCKRKMTEFILNGKDMLNTFQNPERSFEKSRNTTDASTHLERTYQLSSMGINRGIKINL